MKFYAIVRYDRNGNPSKFFNLVQHKWTNELSIECLTISKADADISAAQIDGNVETYNLQREQPVNYRSDLHDILNPRGSLTITNCDPVSESDRRIGADR